MLVGVRGAGLAELFEPLQAVINNGLVAGLGERDAAAEPVLLLHREDLVQRIDLRLAFRRESLERWIEQLESTAAQPWRELAIESAVRSGEDMRKCGFVRLNKGVKHEFSR